jgi:hypothetical protein
MHCCKGGRVAEDKFNQLERGCYDKEMAKKAGRTPLRPKRDGHMSRWVNVKPTSRQEELQAFLTRHLDLAKRVAKGAKDAGRLLCDQAIAEGLFSKATSKDTIMESLHKRCARGFA